MMRKMLGFIIFICVMPVVLFAQKQRGIASYYADKFEGRTTANGEQYSHRKLTAAHKMLPFGTMVKVTNLGNGSTVIVRINDRGPFVANRIIDLSKLAAEQLNFTARGLTEVEIEVVDTLVEGALATQLPLESNVVLGTYFSTEVKHETPEGYGIQVASFQYFDNLLQFMNTLRKSYGSVPFVEFKVINGQKVYAIIVGELKSREAAETLKLKVQQRFPEAFVIAY